MNKYEYKILFPNDDDEEELLNSYGKEGWELVEVTPTTSKFMFILKREIFPEIKFRSFSDTIKE